MNAQENVQPGASLTSSQQAMAELWEQHMRDEFELHDVDKTMETMVDDPFNTNVPVMTGGVGGDGVREFYTKWFIWQNPQIRKSPSSRAPSAMISWWTR